MKAEDVKQRFNDFALPRRVSDLEWFFKTEPGGYGEGDRFIGTTVPNSRKVAAEFAALPVSEIEKLSKSEFHEHRFCALIILTTRFEKSKDEKVSKELFELFMKLLDAGAVNNWDLVDATAPRLGNWLVGRPDAMETLLALAEHEDLWHRRTAVLFTFAFTREFELEPIFVLAEKLMTDQHDLMHKAIGWMLREAGKRDILQLNEFLEDHAATMPRTMLRYSIEKMTKAERADWLSRRSRLQQERDR